MNVLIFRFLKRLLFLTAGIALIMAVLFGFFLKSYYLPVLPFLLLFFFGFTFLTFSFLVKVAQKGFPSFIRAIMLVTVFRLLFYTVIAALYIGVIKEGIVCFVSVMGTFYLIFTLFEVLELMSGLRKSDKENGIVKDKSSIF
jgi:uncharacterized membrane protein YccC